MTRDAAAIQLPYTNGQENSYVNPCIISLSHLGVYIQLLNIAIEPQCEPRVPFILCFRIIFFDMSNFKMYIVLTLQQSDVGHFLILRRRSVERKANNIEI